MPSDPGWLFTTCYDPDPGQDRPPEDLHGEALFLQAERLVALANKTSIEGVSRLFGPDGWGNPGDDGGPWWEPAELLALVEALSAALSKEPEDPSDEQVQAELAELRAILEDENLAGVRVCLRAIKEEFFG